MKNLAANPLPWLAGTLLALTGAALARLGPDYVDGGSRLVVFAGRLMALSGLAVIMLGIRRRLRQEEAPAPPETDDTSAG